MSAFVAQILTSVALVIAGIITAYIETLTATGRRKRALDEGLKTLTFLETWLKIRQQVAPDIDHDTKRAVDQALKRVLEDVVLEQPHVKPLTGIRWLLLLYPPVAPWRWVLQIPFYFMTALFFVTVAGGFADLSLWNAHMALLVTLLLAAACLFRFAATWGAR